MAAHTLTEHALNSPQPCRTCGGEGFVTSAEDRARAAPCEHVRRCARCAGDGSFTEINADGHAVSGVCPCGARNIRRRVDLYNAASLPARFHHKDISAFDHSGGRFAVKQLYVELQDSFEPGAQGVGLTGAPGVGKTHLMTALARYLTLHRGLRVRFVDFAHLLSSLKEGYAAKRSEADLIGPLVGVDVLFIDELGKGRGSDWELGIVDELVSQRYNRGLSIFFATNYPFVPTTYSANANDVAWDRTQGAAESLADRVGARIWSRLQEMCRLEKIGGNDVRPALGRGG